MILVIDATNIADYGGGLTHLREVLKFSDPQRNGFNKVIIIGPVKTLEKIPNLPFLEKKSNWFLNHGYLARYFWIFFLMKRYLKIIETSLLFVPGGFFLGFFRPFVTMSQNMLPFEPNESNRYGNSLQKYKFKLLYILQRYTFNRANGLIFISKYAFGVIYRQLKIKVPYSIIYHGISDRFRGGVRPQLKLSEYSINKPIRVLYVSIIDVYKHQWNVVEAIKILRNENYPIELVLVGRPLKPAIDKLMVSLEGTSEFVYYKNELPFETIEKEYKASDLFLFASSCENCPNIVIEAMSAGLPILSSDRASMPEILKDNAIYFDPENVLSIKRAITSSLENPENRFRQAQRSLVESDSYSWKVCADQTFNFLKNNLNKR